MRVLDSAVGALLLAASMGLAVAAPAATAQGERLQALLEEADRQDLLLNPQAAVQRGDLSRAGEFGDLITDAWFDTAARQLRERLAALQALDGAAFNATERIAHETALYHTRFALRAHDEGLLRIPRLTPLDHLFGQHLTFAQFSSGQGGAPFATVADYEAGLARFDGFVLYLDRAIGQMQRGLRERVVLPRPIVDRVLAQLDESLAQPLDRSPYYQPALNIPKAIGPAEAERLRAAYAAALQQRVRPALQRLRAFMAGPYRAASPTGTPGLVALKGGAALYEYQLESHTTVRMPAVQIHATGLAEVARIRSEIEAIRRRVGFEGNLAAFFRHLQTDARFKFATAEALLESYRAIGTRVDTLLPRWFHRLPQARLEVRAVPTEQQSSASGAYYVIGTPDGTRPGVFYVNTGQLETRTAPRGTALYLHEGLPGHHLQGSLALEDTRLPANLRFNWNAGYGEGWALYAEWLGHEMGLYGDPYQHLGQLDMEIFRAARLVVDTGLHAKGWSRERAVRYLLDNTSLDRNAVEIEVDRYIVWPGQAASYKLGELVIKALRREAEQRLGARFDVRDFHAQVLDTGALPLAVLQAKVRRWIDTTLSATPATTAPKGTSRMNDSTDRGLHAGLTAAKGDFDFLAGEWRIAQRRLTGRDANGAEIWDTFEGEATVHNLLGGAVSVEELRIPARNFAGMGLRMFDEGRGLWSDHWVNGQQTVIAGEPMYGGFSAEREGIFQSDETDDQGQPLRVKGVWDRITPTSCRWWQATSRDGGATWQPNWFMEWTRMDARAGGSAAARP
jgi:uncharacterized protein (DUF885 family)